MAGGLEKCAPVRALALLRRATYRFCRQRPDVCSARPKSRRLDDRPALTPPSPFWSRDRHSDRRPRLAARARIFSAIRRHFEERGFIEVEPAILQVSPGNEAHLHAFATT